MRLAVPLLLAASGVAVGAPCGVVVGLVAALLLLTMIRTVGDGITVVALAKLAPQCAGVPALVFGGKWVAGAVVADVEWASARPSYLLALAATMCLFVVAPLGALAIRITRQLLQA